MLLPLTGRSGAPAIVRARPRGGGGRRAAWTEAGFGCLLGQKCGRVAQLGFFKPFSFSFLDLKQLRVIKAK